MNPISLINFTKYFQSPISETQIQYEQMAPVAKSTPENNRLDLIEYRGVSRVASFRVDSRLMICLPQAFELFLKHIVGGLHTVYTKLKKLNITPVICNVEQVRRLRELGIIQSGVNRCKLISPDEFDILYRECSCNGSRPGRPPKNMNDKPKAKENKEVDRSSPEQIPPPIEPQQPSPMLNSSFYMTHNWPSYFIRPNGFNQTEEILSRYTQLMNPFVSRDVEQNEQVEEDDEIVEVVESEDDCVSMKRANSVEELIEDINKIKEYLFKLEDKLRKRETSLDETTGSDFKVKSLLRSQSILRNKLKVQKALNTIRKKKDLRSIDNL